MKTLFVYCSNVRKGMDIRFEQNQLITEEREIIQWIQTMLK